MSSRSSTNQRQSAERSIIQQLLWFAVLQFQVDRDEALSASASVPVWKIPQVSQNF